MAVASPAEALAAAKTAGLPGPLWVIGGASVYRSFLALATRAEVTVIDSAAAGDAMAPDLGASWRRAGREPAAGWLRSATGLRYRFETWLQAESPS
ncbi:MAG: dihydrofolate reductase [Bifidobacteriaceae bacterium]|nr:dihydrofolate reductase [Bifidobacteriaceae bacterium]